MSDKEVIESTEFHIDELCETLKIEAKKKIRSALNSGAISEDSHFRDRNFLLAMCLVEDVSINYTIRTNEYKKESLNIQKMI